MMYVDALFHHAHAVRVFVPELRVDLRPTHRQLLVPVPVTRPPHREGLVPLVEYNDMESASVVTVAKVGKVVRGSATPSGSFTVVPLPSNDLHVLSADTRVASRVYTYQHLPPTGAVVRNTQLLPQLRLTLGHFCAAPPRGQDASTAPHNKTTRTTAWMSARCVCAAAAARPPPRRGIVHLLRRVLVCGTWHTITRKQSDPLHLHCTAPLS